MYVIKVAGGQTHYFPRMGVLSSLLRLYFTLVKSRDAEGAEVERLRKSNTPQSLLYNTDTSEDLLFQDNLNPGFF
jgi:hypothetical protein